MGNYFTELASVDVSAHVEKKAGFDYLSWPFAVGELLQRHPEATWTVYDFDGSPYKQTPAGCFVKVGVTVNGTERIQWHPVLSGNKTVKEPDAFQVNTSIQRCLVKAIALHGLGLSIYSGEDVPNGDGADEIKPQKQNGKPTPSQWLAQHKITKKTPSFAKLIEKGHEWEHGVQMFLTACEVAGSVASPERFTEFVDKVLGVKDDRS